MNRFICVILGFSVLYGCAGEAVKVDTIKKETKAEGMAQGIYAIIKVSHKKENIGDIILRLYPDKTPITVENFVGLAEGTREFLDHRTGKKVKRPFYDGLIFHRLIPDFMIQGGDPLGNGSGGPGYRFQDEIVSEIKFDSPGKLAMANSGPNTNGSQFFITVKETPWLNGRHTIFGEVVEGQDVINSICKVPRDSRNKPLDPVVIDKVIIKRAGGKHE